MYTIYALADPRTFYIRYVGITEQHAINRLMGHYKDKDNLEKITWLMELKALGLKPMVIILEQGSDLAWGLLREDYWIQQGKDLRWPLINQIGNRHKTAQPPRRRAPVNYENTPQAVSPRPLAPRKWDQWIRAYMDDHPTLWQDPPAGVSDMAREMSRIETGSADSYQRYKGIASDLCRRIRIEDAERRGVANGER